MAVAGPFASGADALEWAAANTPDVAVIDYKLRDGACLSLIGALQHERVPIVIYSGCLPHGADVPPEIGRLPWISKPAGPHALLDVLAKAAPGLLRRAGAGKACAPGRAADSSMRSPERPA